MWIHLIWICKKHVLSILYSIYPVLVHVPWHSIRHSNNTLAYRFFSGHTCLDVEMQKYGAEEFRISAAMQEQEGYERGCTVELLRSYICEERGDRLSGFTTLWGNHSSLYGDFFLYFSLYSTCPDFHNLQKTLFLSFSLYSRVTLFLQYSYISTGAQFSTVFTSRPQRCATSHKSGHHRAAAHLWWPGIHQLALGKICELITIIVQVCSQYCY